LRKFHFRHLVSTTGLVKAELTGAEMPRYADSGGGLHTFRHSQPELFPNILHVLLLPPRRLMPLSTGPPEKARGPTTRKGKSPLAPRLIEASMGRNWYSMERRGLGGLRRELKGLDAGVAERGVFSICLGEGTCRCWQSMYPTQHEIIERNLPLSVSWTSSDVMLAR
jgi:hypothetical protein